MPIELTANEQRVIGCLIEKQIATPDQYPLSINALTNACNQRSNRDPVLDLDEATVQAVACCRSSTSTRATDADSR